MADVSVEFGAKDVGLQDSLQKIQTEMRNLEGKVKSGELSFEELESTMKRLGQVERLEKQLQSIGNESAGTGSKVAGLGKDIQSAGDKSERMGQQSGMGFAKLATAVAVGEIAVKAFSAVVDSAFSAARDVIAGFGDALDLGGRLSDLSASTGETAGNLLLLERAFDTSGAGAEKVGPAIAKMQKSIQDASEGSREAVDALGLMGVTVGDLEGKLPTEQLATLASGINSIDDPTQRAAAAMGIFGRSGADLIPLLTNLDGELSEARDTVGSMAEIMDRRNATFDAVSDRFQIISEKVRDFAAGILDRALPAIDAITTALSRIDAAKIGQELADAFLGGQNAMKGFQAAVNAFKTGQISAGLELLWESTKLQVQQTANSIVNYFTAAFNTVSDIIAMMFRSDGPTIGLIESSFTSLSSLISSKLYTALADFANSIGRLGMEEKFRYQAETAQRSYESAFGAISTLSELAAEDIGTNLAGAADLFSLHVESANKGLFDTSDQVKKIAELEKEIAAKVAETNAARVETNSNLELTGSTAEQLLTVENALAEAIANGNTELATKLERTKSILETKAEEEKKASELLENNRELVAIETQINQAKAAGNEELVKSLESSKQDLESKKEIAKLTEEYQKTLQLEADEAGRLATNFVNAKNAAGGVSVNSSSIKAAKEEAQAAAKAAESFSSWLGFIKDQETPKGIRGLANDSKAAKEEIAAFGDYIGVDLKNKSFPDIARKLGIYDVSKSGQEQIQSILDYVDGQRKNLLVQPIDEAGANTSLAKIQTRLKETLAGQKTDITLDASTSIATIKTQIGDLKGEVDLALSSSKGAEHLSTISGIMGDLKTLITTLTNKLPAPALA